jgi:hypothetical protein
MRKAPSRASCASRCGGWLIAPLATAKSFFVELGLELEGETQVEGPSVGLSEQIG